MVLLHTWLLFFFGNEIFYLKYKTALIIETDTALDFERLSAVDIE